MILPSIAHRLSLRGTSMETKLMYKAISNFAFVGNTYFIGDEVPERVASLLADRKDLIETVKATTVPKPQKSNILEGE